MGDEVISTIPKKENDKIIKSSVDDLVSILKESEVTSVCDDLECDMPITIPLPTTNVREEDFDINSPLGEQVVDFLMENEDLADFPRHLVKQFFSHLVKHQSSTKRISDEPEFEDISSLDPPESTLVIDESTLLVTPLPDSKEISLREVERFDHFFSLTQSGGKTRVMKTLSFGFQHMPSPHPAAYSPKDVMYRYYHQNREFHIGDCVLPFNSKLKIFLGKLKSRWSGPFTVAKVFPYGIVELSQPDGPNFKVNRHRIKHCYKGDILAMDVPDHYLSPKDN
ncbi:hypothetical protein Tco_1360860 [Tanacetum coccineum]